MKRPITKENPFVVKDALVNMGKISIKFKVLSGSVGLTTLVDLMGVETKRTIFSHDKEETILLENYVKVILESGDAEVEYELS